MGSPCLMLLLLLPLLYGELRKEKPGYQLCLQEEVVVQEGLCVRVSCSFTFPRAPEFNNIFGYWYREEDYSIYATPMATNNKRWRKTEAMDRFFLLWSPYDLNCSLGINDVRITDQGTYFFRIEQGYEKYSYRAKKLYLNVTALTEKPVIHVTEPLVSGQSGRLTCSLPGACEHSSLQFSWSGEMLNGTTVTSPELSLTPGPQDHGKNLSCLVRHQGTQRTTKRTIRVNVSYSPQSMDVHIFQHMWTALETTGNDSLSLRVLEGQSLRLLCHSPSNPPATLSWYREETPLSPFLPQSPEILELPSVRAADGGIFTCHARNPLGLRSISVLLLVQESPSCSCECPEQQQGSWPLVITLIRGTLMGAGFLLTYVLTWMYNSRCGGIRGRTQHPTESRLK